jgi:hypothetical protein
VFAYQSGAAADTGPPPATVAGDDPMTARPLELHRDRRLDPHAGPLIGAIAETVHQLPVGRHDGLLPRAA